MRKAIRQFILDYLVDTDVTFGDHDSLYDLNILDSLGVLQLIMFLHDKYSISIDPSSLKVEDFETIDNIIGFLERAHVRV